ncbi:MAG TPA: AAA family ATPase [Verrucomicrobiales bacterium]|nr:AAA family ATPase [Verrucomicrobiales bacterium]
MHTHPADAAARSETAVIQCALHASGPAPMLAAGLKATHFQSAPCGQIWNAICHDAKKRSDGMPDASAILAIIAAQPDNESRALVSELSASYIPVSSHAADYAHEVIAGHARREAIAATVTLQEDLHSGRSPTLAFERLQRFVPIATATAGKGLDWNTAFEKALLPGADFIAQDITPRPALLGSFFREGDFGFIYAPRGVGKTWLAMLMASAVADSIAMGEWAAGDAGPRRVCYVDGEVNLPDAIERARLARLSPNIHWIHHETITGFTGRGLNLADREQQEALLNMLQKQAVRVLFLDNLSCLLRGVAENDADDWDMVLPWLLDLRRAGITVLLIHHAGRNGLMRGTSRREDAAHWILKLDDAGDSDSTGAVFKTTFTKNRNTRHGSASCPPLIWTLATEGDHLTVSCRRHSDVDALVELVTGGMSTARELAAELGVTPGAISKWAHKARAAGRIIISGRQYLPAV